MKTLLSIFVSLLLSVLLMVSMSFAAEDRIQMKRPVAGGVFLVPVTINGIVIRDAVIDSGAAEVHLPADIVRALIHSGEMTADDILPEQQYVQADGKVSTNKRIMIRKMQVGSIVVYNVPASIGSDASLFLLGQSFLEKLSSWQMDTKQRLFIVSGVSEKEHKKVSKKKKVLWFKASSDMTIVAVSNSPCTHADLVDRGYEFLSMQLIPVENLKSPDDAFFSDDVMATTVLGCWSAKRHKAIWNRKRDGRTWVDNNFRVDDTWEKIEVGSK